MQPRASWSSLDVAWLLAVAFAIVFTWWAYRDFTSSFFIFDDFWVLEFADRIYRSGDWLDIFAPTHNFLQYRPFTTVGWFALQRALWGLKPAGYYHVQLAVLALNVVLAFAIGRRLLGSAVAGLAVAMIYATAPGHAMSARWLSQIIIAASVTVYFTGLLLWLRPSPWRWAYATVVLVIGLLTSEHTVTLPMAWTVLVLIGPERWTRAAAFRALGWPWAVAISYVAAKLWYAKMLRETRPFYAQIFLKGYAVDLTPDALLTAIGRYVANAFDPLYGWAGDPAWTARLGLGLVMTAAIAGIVVLFRRDLPPALRVAAVGLVLFFVGLGPVGLMPGHFSACYVGIAALGTALAVVGTACAVPVLGRSLALVVAGACLALYVQQVHAAIRRDPEILLMDATAQNAVRWLYTLDRRTAAGDVREVVVPNEGQNDRLFGAAHRLFLCAPYEVRAVPPEQLQPAPGRLVLRAPDRAPADRLDGAWLPLPCPSAAADGGPE